MLQHETPFPYVGSYALYSDTDLPPPAPTELVRIQFRREGYAAVSFPLRDGASGTKEVPAGALIDATPLTDAERREFHDLDRKIDRRSPSELSRGLRAKAKRRAALKSRIIWSRFLELKLRELRGIQQLKAA